MWTLAFRNVFRQKHRTALTLAAIVLGVASLIVIGGFVEDFFIQLREATINSQYGHLQTYRAGYYDHGRRSPFKYMIETPDELIKNLGQIENVTDVMMRINFSGLISNGRNTFPIIAEGIEPEKEKRLSGYMKLLSGNPLVEKEVYSMVVGQGVAHTLNLEVGSNATLLVNTKDGALNSYDFRVVGIFQTFSKEFDDRAVRIPLAAAQELLATRAVHSLVFALTDTAHTDSTAQTLARYLPDGEFEVKTWYQLADFYQKAVDLYQRYFLVLHLIIIGLVLLSVANSINMTLYERTGEFGTLMAIGNRGATLFKLILKESLVLAAIGSCLGVLVGIAIAVTISSIGVAMPPMPNTNSGYTAMARIVLAEIEKAFLVGFCATLLAAILPGRRASRLRVADALRAN